MPFGEWLVVSALVLASLVAGWAAQAPVDHPKAESIKVDGERAGRQAAVVLTAFLCAIGGVWLLPWAAALPAVPVWAGGVLACLLAVGVVWGWR